MPGARRNASLGMQAMPLDHTSPMRWRDVRQEVLIGAAERWTDVPLRGRR